MSSIVQNALRRAATGSWFTLHPQPRHRPQRPRRSAQAPKQVSRLPNASQGDAPWRPRHRVPRQVRYGGKSAGSIRGTRGGSSAHLLHRRALRLRHIDANRHQSDQGHGRGESTERHGARRLVRIRRPHREHIVLLVELRGCQQADSTAKYAPSRQSCGGPACPTSYG